MQRGHLSDERMAWVDGDEVFVAVIVAGAAGAALVGGASRRR